MPFFIEMCPGLASPFQLIFLQRPGYPDEKQAYLFLCFFHLLQDHGCG